MCFIQVSCSLAESKTKTFVMLWVSAQKKIEKGLQIFFLYLFNITFWTVNCFAYDKHWWSLDKHLCIIRESNDGRIAV